MKKKNPELPEIPIIPNSGNLNNPPGIIGDTPPQKEAGIVVNVHEIKRERTPSQLEMVLEDLVKALERSQSSATKDLQKLEYIKSLIGQKQELFNKRLENIGPEKDEKRAVIQQKLLFLEEKLKEIEKREEATQLKLQTLTAKLQEMCEKREVLGKKPRGLPVFRRSGYTLPETTNESTDEISHETIPNQVPFESAFELLWTNLLDHESSHLVLEGTKYAKREQTRGYWGICFESPEAVIEMWKLGEPLPPMKYEILGQNSDFENVVEFLDIVKSYDLRDSVCVVMMVKMTGGVVACRWEVLCGHGLEEL